MAAMTLGPEMDEEYGRAEGMEPENPRAMLFKAIGTLHKPAFVGGGPGKAQPLFARALVLFGKAAVADSTAIDWGQDDALVWAGICESRLDNWPGALARFREVLALNPGHAWTTYRLLPEAEKQAAAKSGK